MKTLQILGSLCPGGIETWLSRVQIPLRSMGIKMDFACYYPEEEINAKFCLRETVEANGGRVFSISRQDGLAKCLKNLAHILAVNKYDIVHCHNWFSAYALPLAYRQRVSGRVAHIHPVGDVAGGVWILRRLMLAMAKQLIWNTSNALLFSSGAGQKSYGVKSSDNRRHVGVMPLAVDLGSFSEKVDVNSVREKHQLPLDVPLITYTARFEPHKNHRLALRVADCLMEKGVPAHMVFIGSHGSIRQQISAEVSRRKNVTILAGVSNIAEVLLASDMFLFPSLNEGFGVVAVEACAAGLPVIATNLPGIREAIPPELHDSMFAPDNSEEALKSVEALINDVVFRKKQGLICKSWSELFSVQHSADALAKIYYAITTGRNINP